MTRYMARGGQHIIDDSDPGVYSDLSPGHVRRIQSVEEAEGVGFFPGIAAAAAALALIPGKPLTLARTSQTPRPTRPRPPSAEPSLPQVTPAPQPGPGTSDAAMRAELERMRRAQEAAQAQVLSERAAAQKAMREAEAVAAAEAARAAKAEAQLAKASQDAKAYDAAMGKLQAKLAEAQRARDAAIAAGDTAAAAELEKARADAAKAGERAAAELKARQQAEAALAKQEAAQRAKEAKLKAKQADALKAREAELAALRDELKAAGDASGALAAERKRVRAAAAALEAEKQARAAAEAKLAAALEALEQAKANRQTPKAPPAGDPTPRQAAESLRAYLQANPTAAGFGYKGNPNATVQTYQRYMGTPADGIVGPGTRRAATALGVTLPPRPSSSSPQVVVDVGPAVLQTPAQSPTSTPMSQTDPNNPATLAQQLRDYLIANPTARAFGTRGNPSPPVVRFQRAAGMTGSQVDGIVGNQVRTAAARYGVTLPPRPRN